MKKLTLLIVLLIMGMTFLGAQTIADYTFGNTTDGTLEDMTGSTALLTAGTYHDDTASPVTNIGFTFAFGLVGYTQFSANSNGQMQLGATAISGGAASPALGVARLAPLSGDNAIRATGKLHYKVVGTSPNQKLVVEWLDLRVPYSSATETGTYGRMQAWLYQGTNNIKFVYGTMWNMGTSAQARGVYISTSNIAGSVGNVTDIINTMTWTNTGTSVVTTSFPLSSAMANLNSAADGSRRVFSINYPIYTTPPNPAVLVSPANGLWTFTNATLNWTSGGGGAASYDVYFGTSATPPFVVNQGSVSYTPTLAAGTTYYWNIVARNSNGAAAATATWSFKTPTTTQVAESFEATAFPPAGWANGTTGAWTRSTSYFKHGTASAYKYGSATVAYVLSTPRVTITPTSTLDLWTLAGGITGTLQIVYSADRVTWTPIGAPITHAAINTMYNTVADLSSLAGNNYYLGIQTGLQAVGFYVDLVVGPEITPEVPGAPGLTAPADLAVNLNEYPSFSWTAPISGGIPAGYNLYLDTVAGTTLYASNVTSPYAITTALAYNTTYYWTVAAYNSAGTGPMAAVRSFTTRTNPTISTFPWEVNFGTLAADWPVLNWNQLVNVYGTTLVAGTRWYQDDFVNVTTPLNKAARMNVWSANYGWLVTPPIAIPASGYELKFDLGLTVYGGTAAVTAGGQPDDKFMVVISDSPMMTNPTVLKEWNNSGSANVYDAISNIGENHIIDLDAYVGTKYIAFYGESSISNGDNDLFVDNVIVRLTPAAPIFSYAPTSINFGTVMNGAMVGPQNVTITNTGGGTLNITAANLSISGANAGDFSYDTTNLPAALAGGQSVVIPVYVMTVTEGPISATLTITYNATPYTVALSATGLPAGIVTVGNGTANLNLPIYPYFGYTYSQSIFMQTELNVPDQRIEKVYYYWNGVAEAVDSNDWTIYMGHTALTAFATTTSWIPLSGLSTVFTGTVALPAVAGWIEIPLTTPFIYNNTDNLVIAVDENEASYDGMAEFFYCTASATNRSIRYYSDTTNPDPVAPPIGTQVLGYPNVMLQFGDVPVGGPGAPILTYPADLATDLPKAGFNLTWSINPSGGLPDRYMVYMAGAAADILDSEFFWETTNTYFNPITEGGFEYYYEDVWYWTVKAINANGSAVATPFSFTIQADPAITTYPWDEDFEDGIFPPSGWTRVDVDALGTTWAASISYNHTTGGTTSAKHAYSTNPATGQNGWLITPPATIPAGNFKLSWWNYNAFPTYLVYNGVKVNTTNDPNAIGWTELWSPTTVAASWSQAVVDISAYAGQTVYFAFNYQGYDADDWYVDDVSIFELTVDTFGPIITHLPVINTPREDLSYEVYAEIADDPTWNNPIGGANMYYSTDGGTTWSAAIPMTTVNDTTYVASIPAQPLATTVTYKIEAWDSLNNMTTTSNYSFGVNDPTWIWYDQGGTTYLGYTTTDYGPTVLFDNPFYGTDNAMQLLATDGSSYYGNAANLQIWTWDGVNDLVPYFATPIPITFGAQTYHVFDLSTYNVQITDPYFLVSYLDVPMGNYILFDGTYDYGTSYVFQGTTLYMMSNPGSWAIGANVQTGALQALEAPVVTIALVAGVPTLSWTAIAGAGSYNVYGATNPFAADPWTLVGSTALTTYSYTGTAAYYFFKVTADSATPPVRGNVFGAQQSVNMNRLQQAPALRSAPKSELNRIRN